MLNRKVYKVNCQDGGHNGNNNLDAIPAVDFIEPSKNFYLYSGGRQKRGGTTHVSSIKLPSGGTKQLGLFEFVDSSGTRHDLVHGDDGKLYADYGASAIYSSLSTTAKSFSAGYAGKFVITDGATKPKTWDGSSMADFTNYAADWGAGNYPSVFINHGQQAAARLWGLVQPSNPFDVYASNIGGTDFGSSSVVKLHIDTGDGVGLVGAAQYGERLICFGKKKAKIILDIDPDVANWGYQDVQWEGGAAHRFLIVPTQNDVVCMTDDGDIYSVSTVINYGDYKAASLVRPSYMHIWIKDNLDLSRISQFHAIYDSAYRRIIFFVVRLGFTVVNTAMCFWIDRPLEKAWSILDNLVYDSGFGAVCSTITRPSAGVVQVRTGGYTGYSWKHDQATISDDGNPYECKVLTTFDPFENPRETKHYMAGRAILSPVGNASLGMTWAVDEMTQGSVNIPLTGQGSVFGTALYGDGSYGSNSIVLEATYDLGQVGKRIQYLFSNNNLGEGIDLSEFMTDFRPLGINP